MKLNQIRSVNGHLVCRPFGYKKPVPGETRHVSEPEKPKKGLSFVNEKFELAPLEVLCGNIDTLAWRQSATPLIRTGDTVYVRADHVAHPYAKAQLYIPGIEDPNDPGNKLYFILVPLTEIVAVAQTSCDCGDAATPAVPATGTVLP